MTHLELRKIDQTFGGQPLLRQLDLVVESGDYVVLVGPSGCGKTTTLRVIAGLQKPNRGQVLFDDASVDHLAPRDRDVAMVFQHDGLYPHLTIDQSIRFSLRGRMAERDVDSRVAAAVELTRIEPILGRYPSRLSGGELRRAALAKAIARRSSVLLLDEPLSALDVSIRQDLQDDILRWHASDGGTTIHVTHDGQEAIRLADKVAVVDEGRIVQFAEPSEILAKPCNVSVAKTMGTPRINLIDARSVHGKIESCSSSVKCCLKLDRVTPDGDVQVGIMPESFERIDSDDSTAVDSDREGILVTGRLMRFQSMLGQVHLEVISDDEVIHAVLPHESFRVGETIRLYAARDVLHIFDASSGLRIESSDRG